MMVRIDDIFDRFVRHEFFCFGDDRHRPRITLRRFDDDQVIFHLDQHTVMRPAAEVPYALRRLLGLYGRWIGAHIFRNFDL